MKEFWNTIQLIFPLWADGWGISLAAVMACFMP